MTTLNIVGQTAVNGCRIQVGPAFTPASLFTASEQGAWYDPSDFSTLYQNSAGTTAVTTVEQPVGLMLDKSQGLTLGSELVDAADEVADWSTSGSNTITIDEDAIKISFVDSSVGASLTLTDAKALTQNLVAGKTYKFSCEAKVNTGYGASVSLTILSATTNPSVPVTNSTFQEFSFYFIADGSNETFRPTAMSVGEEFWIKNISIRELPGNHATQATSAARPALRNRYNLLTFSEQFDNPAWTKSNATVTANSTTAPDGTTTADLVYPANSSESYVRQYSSKGAISQTVIVSLYFKPAGFSYILLQTQNSGNGVGRWFNISTGTVESPRSFGTGWTLLDSQIQNIGDGWFRATIVALTDSSNQVSCTFEPTNSDNTVVSTPSGTSGIYVWGAQIVSADDNTAIQGQYQRIEAAPTIGSAPTYDDDLTKFPPYLAFDGSDDSMATASIDFSATDEMSVFAGVTKLSDAATAIFCELSASISANNGVFALLAPSVSGDNSYKYSSKGTFSDNPGTGIFAAAPNTSVLSGLSDISADTATLRRNGSVVENSTNDQGTGNFGNYPLYIGSRGGTSFRFNGRLYGLIVRGVTSTLDEIRSTETWMSGKTGV